MENLKTLEAVIEELNGPFVVREMFKRADVKVTLNQLRNWIKINHIPHAFKGFLNEVIRVNPDTRLALFVPFIGPARAAPKRKSFREYRNPSLVNHIKMQFHGVPGLSKRLKAKGFQASIATIYKWYQQGYVPDGGIRTYLKTQGLSEQLLGEPPANFTPEEEAILDAMMAADAEDAKANAKYVPYGFDDGEDQLNGEELLG